MKKPAHKAPQRKADKVAAARPAGKPAPRWSWGLAYVLFFPAYFVVAALWAEPRVQYFGRPAAFRFDDRFFNTFLIRPGGISECLACGLHQCYQFTWLGATVTTVLAALLALGAWLLLRKLGPGPARTLCLWPALGLLAVQRQYSFPWLETGLGLLGAVWLATAYAWLPAKRPWLRWLAFLAISPPAYGILAGAYLVFAFYCGLIEILAWRRYWLALALWCLAAVVPALGASYFAVHRSDAYLLLLPFGLGQFPIVLAALPFAALALAALAKTVRSRLPSAVEVQPARSQNPPRFAWRRLAEPALLLLLAATAVGWGWNGTTQRLARIKSLSHDRDWAGVLREDRLLAVYDPSTITHVNRALAQSGRLPYDMFAYPQKTDYDFWFYAHATVDRQQCLVASDMLFELGQVNRAERMAGEALELSGYLPDVLKRLADVNVLKGEPQIARIFLNVLAKTPFQHHWARERLRALDADPQLTQDADLQRVRALMLTGDFPLKMYTEDILLESLHQNNTNRVAFEYLMAYHLLNRDLDSFLHYLRAAKFYNYHEIPAHYEEAIVLAQHLKGAPLAIPNINGQQPRQETIQRFERFAEQLARYANDLPRAEAELAPEFGNTYWYYYNFGASGAALVRTDLYARKP